MNADIWPDIMKLTKRYDPDPDHACQVCNFSLRIFDSLYDIHHMKKDYRDLLKAGSLLHDIGWNCPGKPHHKASRDLILSDTTIPFNKKERIMVSLIARYHRKSYPDNRHAIFRDLDPFQQHIIRYCSGMLRIADALDRTHDSRVKSLETEITPDIIIITCTSLPPLFIDKSIFSEKAGLLEMVTNHRICLICN